jgi:hypothetical protein
MVAFRCYDPSDDGSGGIHSWYYREISSDVRSAIDGALELMAREAKLDGHPSFKSLRLGRRCLGLAEIKIDLPVTSNEKSKSDHKKSRKKKHNKKTEIHIRLLGPDNPPNVEFILLIGFLKTGNHQYGPMCKQAQNRKKRVTKDATRAKPCRFPKASDPRGEHSRQALP